MDIWEAEYMENMKNIGNEKSNSIYEVTLNEGQRPRWGDKTGLSNFIREKYAERRFCERVKKNNQNNKLKNKREEDSNEGENVEVEVKEEVKKKTNENLKLDTNTTPLFEDIFTTKPNNNEQQNGNNNQQRNGNNNQQQNGNNNQQQNGNNEQNTRQNIKDNIMKMFEVQNNGINQQPQKK